MQHTARTRTALDDLQVVVDHWTHLRALIDTSQTSDTWPPAMGKAEYLRALDDHDRDETALLLQHAQHLVTTTDEHGRPQYECLHCDYAGEGRGHLPRPNRRPDQLGERAQRDTVKALRRPIPGDPVGVALGMLAARDEADPARWRFNLGKRTAVRAAEWLLGRLRGDEGPCLPLRDHHRAAIGLVAREAARRIERTIGGTVDRYAVAMDRPCPYCDGALTMHAGGGVDDAVTCSGPDCEAPVGLVDGRRMWSTPAQLAVLQRELGEAARRRKRAEDRARQRAAARARQSAA